MAKSKRTAPVTVGPFVFAYPHLTSPDTEGQYADNKYKVDGIGDPNQGPMKAAKAAVIAALKELGVPAKGSQTPLKAETSKNQDTGKREATGNHQFRCKSQYAPVITDASGTPIPAKALAKMKIGAGSEGLLQGYFSDYVMTAKERVDGELVEVKIPGISFTLTGVQLIKCVAGGGASASFAAYEGGGFTYEGAADADEDDLDVPADGDAASDDDDGGLDI